VTSLAVHVDQLFYPTPGGIGTYVRNLVPALRAADPELDIALFHARFGTGPPGRADRPPDLAEPTERLTKAFWTEEIPGRITTLYPRWALAGRPALPHSLSDRDLLHAPSPAAVPPAGADQRLIVTVHDRSEEHTSELQSPS